MVFLPPNNNKNTIALQTSIDLALAHIHAFLFLSHLSFCRTFLHLALFRHKPFDKWAYAIFVNVILPHSHPYNNLRWQQMHQTFRREGIKTYTMFVVFGMNTIFYSCHICQRNISLHSIYKCDRKLFSALSGIYTKRQFEWHLFTIFTRIFALARG